jgi:hypothetical protein
MIVKADRCLKAVEILIVKADRYARAVLGGAVFKTALSQRFRSAFSQRYTAVWLRTHHPGVLSLFYGN